MNEIYRVEELAYMCHDFSTHVNRIEMVVNNGDVVVTNNENIDSWRVLELMKEDDGDFVNEKLSNLSFNTTTDRKFLEVFDDKLTKLAEEAARSYKGKYND